MNIIKRKEHTNSSEWIWILDNPTKKQLNNMKKIKNKKNIICSSYYLKRNILKNKQSIQGYMQLTKKINRTRAKEKVNLKINCWPKPSILTINKCVEYKSPIPKSLIKFIKKTITSNPGYNDKKKLLLILKILIKHNLKIDDILISVPYYIPFKNNIIKMINKKKSNTIK